MNLSVLFAELLGVLSEDTQYPHPLLLLLLSLLLSLLSLSLSFLGLGHHLDLGHDLLLLRLDLHETTPRERRKEEVQKQSAWGNFGEESKGGLEEGERA
jgi:hypothetical protein